MPDARRRCWHFAYVICSIVFMMGGVGSVPPDINSNLFRDKVEDVVKNSLKFDDMQRHYDANAFTDIAIDGQSVLNALAGSLHNKFSERLRALNTLPDKIDIVSTSNKLCCNITNEDDEYDPRFKQRVTQKTCVRISSNAPDATLQLSTEFEEQCANNLRQIPLLKWQYFASEDGITTQFPGSRQQGCRVYEPRFRPWYVKTNSPRAKQIAIVINRGRSLHTDLNRIEIAKQVAQIVIDSLNPRDQVAVFGFSDVIVDASQGTDGLSSCVTSEMALAIPGNKRKLINFVESLRTNDAVSDYTTGLSKAFDFFDQMPVSENTDRIIVFLSDGSPVSNCAEIFEEIHRRNAGSQNSVVIMTFGVGTDGDFSVLRDMAKQSATCATTPSNSSAPIREGKFQQISDTVRLRNQLTSFYNFFSVAASPTILWTVPYFDLWGLGVVITVAKAVTKRSQFAGVVAVDMTLSELLEESTYFQPNELSYSFVIDEQGLIINHPLFPYVNDADALIVEATAFETDPEFASVFKMMKAGIEGTKTFEATRILADGDDTRYGIKSIKVLSTYFWKKISDTPFRLCVVIPSGGQQGLVPNLSPLEPFLYHRLDVVAPPNPCSYQATLYCAKHQSTVALSPRSFNNPESYLSTATTKEWIESLKSYMEGKSNFKPSNVKTVIRNAVTLTKQAEELWMNANESSVTHTLFRYIGTKDGVFRSFPGCILPKGYDHATRSWYLHAVANRGDYAVTPPYLDVRTQMKVITFSKVLYDGKAKSHVASDAVAGVMGIDLFASDMTAIFENLYPECSQTSGYRCSLIDKSGYIVWPDVASQNIAHLTLQEPEISNALIRDKIMVMHQCAIIADAKRHQTYKISVQGEYSATTSTNTEGNCFDFSLLPVSNTNTFILIRAVNLQTQGCSSGPTSCPCPSATLGDQIEATHVFLVGEPGPGTTGKIRARSIWDLLSGWTYCTVRSCSTSNADCICPCKDSNPGYDQCTNSYLGSNSSTSAKPCVPKNNPTVQESITRVSVAGLSDCSSTDQMSDVGLIIGLVIGGMAVVVVSVLIAIKICRTKTKQAPRDEENKRDSCVEVAQDDYVEIGSIATAKNTQPVNNYEIKIDEYVDIGRNAAVENTQPVNDHENDSQTVDGYENPIYSGIVN